MPRPRHALSFIALAIHAVACLIATLAAAQLDTALKVRSLSPEQAKDGVPVHLRAMVHFIEPPGTVFVQDETAGTFLRTKTLPGDLKPGDVVEVNGKSFPGLFLPGVETSSFHVIGHGELPRAQPATHDDLVSARFHYQRVSVEGIVRSVSPLGEDKSTLRLAMGARVLEARVDAEPAMLVDAKVRVTGLAAGTINDLRQLVQPYLRVASWQDVVVIEPAPTSAGHLPVVKPSQLLRFDPAGEHGHRVLVEGEVTAVFPARGLMFLRDDTGSIAVKVANTAEITPGTILTIPGFATMDRFTPTLDDTGEILHAEPGATPAATATHLADMRVKVRDGDLVQLTGIVAETYRTADGQSVQITEGGQSIIARLDAHVPVSAGEQVRLTGIARVEEVSGKGFNARPEKFSLWLRAPDDAVVLRAPSPWTVRRLITILGVLAVIAFAATIWIVLLRRQVAALRQRVRSEAALEERQRIAREFHDTLEQELAGLSLRLDAAASRPLEDKARGLLDTSRSLVSRVQIEARNLVADLRDDESPPSDLPAALDGLVHRLPANAPLVRVDLHGHMPALSGPVVHHLRMIAQEAVTNAIKHARAKNITLSLRAHTDHVELAVADDGTGFDPSTETSGKPGHFGCMGIRERCRKIGARADWQSAPGHGTTMTVTCPAPA